MRRRAAEADRYAAVPTFREDMPIEDEPGTGRRAARAAATPQQPASPAARPEAPVHGRVVPSRTARWARQVRQAPAAAAPDALQAGQEVTAPSGSCSRSWSVDVPDYPEKGVVFKDITPLLADHDGVHRGRGGARGRRP